MGFDIALTGVDDLQQPWKMAFCGFPGSGKTLLASTAPDPYFLFFRKNPRYKSIVARGIPHTKVLNTFDGVNNMLVESVQDRLLEVVRYLQFEDHGFKTLVVDTGDEMFQSIKEARIAHNNGEWNISDWGWLGDTYREIVNRMIDLPMHVIFLFHVKTNVEDDLFVRELALQGSVKDEAAGWFDLVAALESFSVPDEDGNEVSKRFVITQPSRSLPWVKDHSGKLPGKIQISHDFSGDIDGILRLLSTAADGLTAESEVYLSVATQEAVPERVITGEMIKAKKEERKRSAPSGAGGQEPSHETTPYSPTPDGEAFDKASDALKQQGIQFEEHAVCGECGGEVTDENVIEMSKAKFGKVYCRNDFKAKIRNK